MSVYLFPLVRLPWTYVSPLANFVAVGLLVMMYPILCKVRYETLHKIMRQKELWKQMGFSIFINWIVAPFFMVR